MFFHHLFYHPHIQWNVSTHINLNLAEKVLPIKVAVYSTIDVLHVGGVFK